MKIPFDIKFRPQIESGEYKLITRQGGYAEILKWDLLGDRHILAVVETEYDESPFKYWPDGHIVSGIDENYDLFIITPEPELSKFEDALKDCVNMRKPENPMTDEGARNNATILRAIAFKEFKENEASHMKELVDQKEKEAYERGKAEVLRTHATELTENLAKSGLDEDSIPYHLIEFMCNLYDCQNWKEIEDTAELYTTRVKAAALKDLPRWRKDKSFETEGTFMGVKGRECFVVKDGYSISVAELIKKLPGFKED